MGITTTVLLQNYESINVCYIIIFMYIIIV